MYASYLYMIVRSKSCGYALFKKHHGFWQQCTKWYAYLGNLKRYNDKARLPAHYLIED